MVKGSMRVSFLFHSRLTNEKSRVSALDQKSVRTIAVNIAVPKRMRYNPTEKSLAVYGLGQLPCTSSAWEPQ